MSLDFVLGRLGGARSGLLAAAGLQDVLSRPDAAARQEALRGSAWSPAAGAGPGAVEEALAAVVLQEAARLLEELGGGRRRLVATFLLSEDARALKGPVRAVARSLPVDRAAELLEPSPGLDRAALRELAACGDGPALAARLAAAGSRFAGAFAPHAAGLAKPGALLRAEIALDGVAGEALARESRGPGEDRRVLRRLGALRTDACNACTLLSGIGEADADGLWLRGGALLGADLFHRLAGLPARERAEALAEALEPLVGPPGPAAGSLRSPLAADHLLGRALAREARREARWAPLSLAVPCAWLLELGEELRRVRLVLRAAAEGYPAAALLDLLEA